MFHNFRFFVLSRTSLDFREVRFLRTKVVTSGFLTSLGILGLVLLLNHFSHDILGLGYDRMSMLAMENRLLKEQIRDLHDKMGLVEKSLEKLSVRGNELRLKANLSSIDSDTREASVGGATMVAANAFITGDAGAILRDAEGLIQKLTREVKLQRSSYEEIEKQFAFNKEFFTHMPAIKPMAGYYSINGFGMRIHPVLQVYRMHEGVDIINDDGTKIYAAGDGVVRFSGRTQGGYGVVIEVSHGYGYSTLYAHLSKVLVQPGRTVKRGELIGLSGRSGLVSGPHLHYEVRKNGVRQNPVDFFFDDVNAARYRVLLAEAK
jgi:murein DD-endopeptidase MepM/ murein hydrolase activator NlpD